MRLLSQPQQKTGVKQGLILVTTLQTKNLRGTSIYAMRCATGIDTKPLV